MIVKCRESVGETTPKIYRIIKKDDQERPLTGNTTATLGIRVATDIQPDAQGNVQPNTGGMSVSPSFAILIKRLPARMVPARFNSLVPGAIGRDTTFVWCMGEGPFQMDPVHVGLQLTIDSSDIGHGLVEPDTTMTLNEYVTRLHATKGEWTIDEPEGV